MGSKGPFPPLVLLPRLYNFFPLPLSPLQSAFRHSPPREVIVFIIGGSTYEESKSVHDWNERNPHMRVLLGGSAVLNSEAFLGALTANVAGGRDDELR